MPLLGAARSAALLTRSKLRAPNGTPEAELISAMIVQAVKHMRLPEVPPKQDPARRTLLRSLDKQVLATTWLASTRARSWFELLGVDQRYALDSMKWVDHARLLIEAGNKSEVTPKERSILLQGIAALANPYRRGVAGREE